MNGTDFTVTTCPNCHMHYDSEEMLVPRDEEPKIGCLRCMEGWDRNGVTLVMGLIDYGRRDDEGNPQRLTTTVNLSPMELARTDNRDFWEMATEQMAADVISEYRSDDADD